MGRPSKRNKRAHQLPALIPQAANGYGGVGEPPFGINAQGGTLFLSLLPDPPESCPPVLRFGRENNPHRRTRSLDSGLPDPPPHQIG